VKTSLLEAVDQAIANFQNKAPAYITDKLQTIVTSLGSIMVVLVVLPIITLWLMLEMNPLRARILMLVPPIHRRVVTDIAASINELLGRYVRGQIVVCSLFGLLCTITFYILHLVYGMDYWLVLGALAAFIYIVPYIGMATIATSAGLAAYFSTNSSVPCTVIAVGSCVIFNLIIDYGVSPRVLGRGVGLHPLLVIFALLSGAQVGGVFGMVLAIPVFASLRVIAIRLFPQLTAPIPQASAESDLPENASMHATATDIVNEAERAEASVTPARSASS
jgi:predicted PurR-regulated permease PerM